MTSLDFFFFSAYPYIAIIVFLVGTTYRYRETGFKVTSLSAQFLEGKQGFWGTVPFHFGILMVFLGHMAAFLMPGSVLAWNSDPVRLIAHEGLSFTFAVALAVGLVALIIRRLTAADLSPYLWSILKLSPQTDAVVAMPIVIKAHIIGAFSILLIFPFTRLVHIVVAPFHYLWRPYQVVIWYWDKKRVRDANTEWSEARPRNN